MKVLIMSYMSSQPHWAADVFACRLKAAHAILPRLKIGRTIGKKGLEVRTARLAHYPIESHSDREAA